MDERWVHATPERMLEWFIDALAAPFPARPGGPAALPDEPGGDRRGAAALCRGSSLRSSRIADQALFLQPDLDDMRERLLARGPMAATSDGVRARENATARDLLIAELFEREARELRLPTLRVDAPLEEMIERAAAMLAPVVDRLPSGGDLEAGTPVRGRRCWRRRCASTRSGSRRLAPQEVRRGDDRPTP